MAKYRLYAGLSGGFGGLVYQGTEEFKSQQEAEWRAYDIAWEEYESYGGNHGLLDWDACYEDALEAEWIDPHSQSQEEIERIVDDHYREQVVPGLGGDEALCESLIALLDRRAPFAEYPLEILTVEPRSMHCLKHEVREVRLIITEIGIVEHSSHQVSR